jgi:hypothetical protein
MAHDPGLGESLLAGVSRPASPERGAASDDGADRGTSTGASSSAAVLQQAAVPPEQPQQQTPRSASSGTFRLRTPYHRKCLTIGNPFPRFPAKSRRAKDDEAN